MQEADEHSLRVLLSSITRLPVSDGVIEQAVSIRRTHKIKLPDALILATAIHYGLELITLDDKLDRLAGVILSRSKTDDD